MDRYFAPLLTSNWHDGDDATTKVKNWYQEPQTSTPAHLIPESDHKFLADKP